MDYTDLQKIQKESTEQVLPQQKKVLSAADKDYVLSREKVTDSVKLRNGASKTKGERFKAVLKAKHIFEKSSEQ